MARAAFVLWPAGDAAPLAAALAHCAAGGLLAAPGEVLHVLVEDDVALRLDRLAERAGAWELAGDESRPLADWQPLAAWPGGRVFGSLGELRWQRREGWLHAVLITDAAGALPEGLSLPLELPAGEPAAQRLWGMARDGAWRDGRIPDDLAYPLPADDGSLAWLAVCQYRDERGAVAWNRWAGLEVRKE